MMGCVGVYVEGVVEAMTLSSASWLLDLGAGQAALHLGFVPWFPRVALEPMPGASSGSPDPGASRKHLSPLQVALPNSHLVWPRRPGAGGVGSDPVKIMR